MPLKRARLTSAATMLAAMAFASTSLSAMAANDSGDISVTGESVATIELTITNTTAAFGNDLTPDGLGGSVTGYTDDVSATSSGACYFWDGTGNAQVRSNSDYDLSVDVSTADVAELLFDNSGGSWLNCTAGTPATTSMYGSAWQTGSATANTSYDTNLGIVVLWTDAPADYAATLTLTAVTTP